MAAHRYWRVYISATRGGGWPALSQVIFRTVAAGAQAAVGGTPLESGHYADWTAARAFDADNASSWSAGDYSPAWIGYDFGASNPVDIVEVALRSRGDGGDWGADSPSEGRIEYSDNGSSWTPAFTFTVTNWTAGAQLRTATLTAVTPPTAAARRYWRLRMLANNTGQTGMGEISMAATPGGADQCTGGTAFASGSYGGSYSPSSAFDNNSTSNWFQSGSYVGIYIGYDFGTPVDVNEVRVVRAAEDPPGTFHIFVVESSPDNVAWTFEWLCYNTAWSSATAVVFTRPTVQVSNRWWGMWSEDNQIGGNDVVLSEMEFMEVSGGADVTGSGTPSYFPADGGYPVANLFDNNTSTIIYAGTTGKHLVVRYDFGSAKTIVQAAMRSSIADGFNNNQRAPKVGRFIYSQDGRSWLPATGGEFTGLTWGHLDRKTFSLTDAPPAPPTRRKLIVVT